MDSFRRGRGFSVIEALVALMLLAFGIYSAADMIIRARTNAVRTERNVQAKGLANLKLEELRLAGSELLSRLGDGPAVEIASEVPGNFEQNPRYSWSASVERADIAGTSESLRIIVDVYRAGTRNVDGRAMGLCIPQTAQKGEYL